MLRAIQETQRYRARDPCAADLCCIFMELPAKFKLPSFSGQNEQKAGKTNWHHENFSKTELLVPKPDESSEVRVSLPIRLCRTVQI